MTSSNGNIFRVTGPLCGEVTGHRWIPRTKASDAELWCFLWSAPWINGWINNREAGDLRRQRGHYDVIVMIWEQTQSCHDANFAVSGGTTDCHYMAVCGATSYDKVGIMATMGFQWTTSCKRVSYCAAVRNATLTYWGRDKMAAVFMMAFSNAFSRMKIYEFR